MKIVHQILLSIFLFFISLFASAHFSFAMPLEGSGGIREQVDRQEKLSFDAVEKNKEIDLSSADENKPDDKKTIRELKNNIQELQSDKKVVTSNFQLFILKNGKLRKFFREKITDEELEVIEKIIIDYNGHRKKVELLIKGKATQLEDTSVVTSDLLSLKKELYISFLPYVDISKVEGYKAFIKADVIATKQDKNIQSDIYKKEKIVDSKQDAIEEKIKEHERSLEEKKNKIIEEKISTKLEVYKQNERFKKLSSEQQRVVFRAVLHKLQERRKRIEMISGEKNREKIELYKTVEKVLEEFIKNL